MNIRSFLTSLFLMAGVAILHASPVEIEFRNGTNSLNNVPGLKLTLPITTESDQQGWKLTAFTWLTSRSQGAIPTGAGRLWIFDAAEFDPEGKKPLSLKSSDPGFVGQSLVFDAESGVYTFPHDLILAAGKSYYFLNEGVVSSAHGATANYGASTASAADDMQRLSANNGAAPWNTTEGTPNFSATFAPTSNRNP